MMKYLLFGGLIYLYLNQKKQTDAAMADRNALLSILTPDQQAALLSAIQAAGQIAQGAVTGATTAAGQVVTGH
jgi:hypothetical protein